MTDLLQGQDIAKLLRSEGPVVKAVLLRCSSNDDDGDQKPSAAKPEGGDQKPSATDNDKSSRPVLVDLIDQIEVDTTPKKNMVETILGGPFTFVGQYEEEGTVLMVRRDGDDLPLNPHKLQPPFDHAEIRGNVLILKVAETEEVLDEDYEGGTTKDKELEIVSNEEFFLDYPKEEYIRFASRTDVVAPEPPEEEEEEVEDEEESEEEEQDEEEDEEYNVGEDMEDEEDQVAMMNLIMGQVLRKFHEENGRGPDTRELLALRSALAQKMGIDMPEIPEEEADWDQKAAKPKKETIKTQENDASPVKSILTRKRTVNGEDDDDDGDGQEAKKVKFSHPGDDQEKVPAAAALVTPEVKEA